MNSIFIFFMPLTSSVEEFSMYKTILYLNILLVQKGRISIFLIVVFPLCLLRLPIVRVFYLWGGAACLGVISTCGSAFGTSGSRKVECGLTI